MKIIKTKFKNLIIYKKETHKDKRDILENFIYKNISKQNFPLTLCHFQKKCFRGLHLQTKKTQAKIVTVLKGKIFDVCVDCRKKSMTFGNHFSITLSENENTSLLIPAGFAHGFYALTNNVVLHYKCSNYRHKESETGILWNDKTLKIKWPNKKPIISDKDKKNITFKEFISKKF